MVYDGRMVRLSLDPALSVLLGSCGALLFLSAALHKLTDRRRFTEVLAAYDLLPQAWVAAASRTVPLLEAVTGLALLLPATSRAAAVAASALLLSYAAAIGVNLQRGRRDLTCGCGGPADRQPIAAWMVIRNVAVAALLGLAWLPRAERALEFADLITIVCGAATAALIYLSVERLADSSRRLMAGRRP